MPNTAPDFRQLCELLTERLEWYIAEDDTNENDPSNSFWLTHKLSAQNAVAEARAALAAEPQGAAVAMVEAVAEIIYENALKASASDLAKPHWPAWSELPNCDARIHSLHTAELILARWGKQP